MTNPLHVDPSVLTYVERKAELLVEEAHRLGVVLTIDQKPLQPLAMGHYKTEVSVREERPQGT